MTLHHTERDAQRARVEAIERGDADASTLVDAWRDVYTLAPALRTRMLTAVARAPSLPPSLATEVLFETPVGLLANPALPLLLLDAPTLLDRAPKRFWNVVSETPTLAPALLPSLLAAAPSELARMLMERPTFDVASESVPDPHIARCGGEASGDRDAASTMPTDTARSAAASAVERTRRLLEQTVSDSAGWRRMLAWAASGDGLKPIQRTLSPHEQARLLPTVVDVLGEDLATNDATALRLFDVMIEALDALPLLTGASLRSIAPGADTAARRALAERWIATLRATGRTEGRSVALVLDTRACDRTGTAAAEVQHALATVIFEDRVHRLLPLVDEVSRRSVRARFLEDLLSRARASRTPEAVHDALCCRALREQAMHGPLRRETVFDALRDCEPTTLRALLAELSPSQRRPLLADASRCRLYFRAAGTASLEAAFDGYVTD